MSFITAQNLKDDFNKTQTADVDSYYSKVLTYIEEALRRENITIRNTVVFSLFPDYRISSMRLHSSDDPTSPYIEVDYGLLKNKDYSFPARVVNILNEKLDLYMDSLASRGFSVSKFWGYFKGFSILDQDIIYEDFTPVHCYRISWDNSTTTTVQAG